MSEKQTNILNKLYFISGCMFVFALLVVFKLTKIQFFEGTVTFSSRIKDALMFLIDIFQLRRTIIITYIYNISQPQ